MKDMRSKSFSTLLVIAMVMAAAMPLMAQPSADTVGNLPGIQIETSVDRAEILIGDQITYTFTVTYDSTYELIPPPLGANLGGFDVKDYQTDLVTRLPDGRRQSASRFVLSTFTTGDYVIPPMPAVFNLPDGTRKAVLSEPVAIKVNSLLDEGADSLDIKPQKPVYEFQRDYTKYYTWGGIALGLLLLGAYLWWRHRRRRGGQAEPVDLRPPWEIAFEQLAFLKEKPLLSERRFKEYYLELTDIVRSFLGRMYEVDTMEMTTDEFIVRFSEIRLPGSLFARCREFFPHADLVKFAKYQPESGRAEADIEAAHNMVELVRSDFARRSAESASPNSTNSEPSKEVPV
ncbi:MAG: BatD family protein [bacterium]